MMRRVSDNIGIVSAIKENAADNGLGHHLLSLSYLLPSNLHKSFEFDQNVYSFFAGLPFPWFARLSSANASLFCDETTRGV